VSRRLDVGKLLESLSIFATLRHREWRARCPNREHEDRTPSWRMVDDPGGDRHGFHKCWPCGFAGDAIQLVRRVQGLSYGAARQWIEEFAMVDGTPITSVRLDVAMTAPFAFPPGVVVAPFVAWPVAFRRYLESRGVTTEQADRWGLGYAIEGRLSGRVVFPIRNRAHQLVSYSARAIGPLGARYLTPSREEGPDNAAIFGEQEWRGRRGAVVVEGALDALAVERLDGRRAWALAGLLGAGVVVQPRVRLKLERFEELVVLTDSDPAGDHAHEVIRDSLRRTRVVRARPPDGLDATKMDPRALRGIIVEARRRS
jgi:DNA primase